MFEEDSRRETILNCPICGEEEFLRQPVAERDYWWYCISCGNQGRTEPYNQITVVWPIRQVE